VNPMQSSFKVRKQMSQSAKHQIIKQNVNEQTQQNNIKKIIQN